jgi:hypothetical protein
MRKPLFFVPIRFRGRAFFSLLLSGGLLLGPAAEAKDRRADVSAAVNRSIEGKVTDQNGEAIPGVNVRVDGTTQGAMTDANGSFKLSVPDGQVTLLFSSVGYLDRKLTINATQTLVNVSLEEDSKLMSEVVVLISPVRWRRCRKSG